MAFIRSRVSVNHFGAFLAQRNLSTQDFARKTGLPQARVQALKDDPRLLPDVEDWAAFARGFPGDDPATMLTYAPEDPEATAADMVPNATGPLQVTVCGCGNLGHVFAGLLGARPDVGVRVLVSTGEKAERLNRAMAEGEGVTVHLPGGRTVKGRPDLVTADPTEAVPGARLILLCVPSHVETATLQRVLPFVEGEETYIGSIPAPGGFDWKAHGTLKELGKSAVIFGMGFIPWMCKVAEYGRSVNVLGSKITNIVAVHPAARAAELTDLLGHLLQTAVLDVHYFLNLTLHQGNQVLHPGIMYDLFRAWDGLPLAEPPLFYEGISETAPAILERLSDEILTLREALEASLPEVTLPLVLPLQTSILYGYGAAIHDPSTLRSTIASNLAYAGIRTPMVRQDGGWAPDWRSRFFLEDVPHGLVVLRGLADLLDVSVPTIDELLTWAQARMGREYLVDGRLSGEDLAESGAPARFGIRSLSDLQATF